MRYLLVTWIHESPDDPVRLYSELDDASWEVRKVEVFRDGRLGFAGPSESSGSTFLGLEPVPPPEVIALDPQFRPEAITRAEFEPMWDRARSWAGASPEWTLSRTEPLEG